MAKTLGSIWENFNNNNSVSVIIPASASKEVTFSMAMTKGFKHLRIQYVLILNVLGLGY